MAAITARFHSVYSRRRTRRKAKRRLVIVTIFVDPLLRSPIVRSVEASRGLVELPECQVRGRTGRVTLLRLQLEFVLFYLEWKPMGN